MLRPRLKETDRFTRLAGSLLPLRSRCFSTQPAIESDSEADGSKSDLPKPYRTNVDSPSKHQRQHLAKFYTVPKSIERSLFGIFQHTKQSRQLNSFMGEMGVMVREPFLEIREYIESYDYSQPALRMVVYGKLGVGKSFILGHTLHYAVENSWLVIANSWMPEWLKRPKDTQPNAEDPTILETPVEGAIWLQHFRAINERLLEKLQLKTTSTWKFSDTEVIAEGEPLIKLVAHGIDRMKHSNQCVRSLLHEVKKQTNEGKTKTMVVLGGVNCLWETSYVKDPKKQFIPARNFHLLQSFKEILKNDWKNASAVVSVAAPALSLTHRNLELETVPSYMPQYLLGKEGFEFFEPFVPIRVEKYSDKEAESVLEYYTDMNFIQHPKGRTEAARNELKFLSGRNPRELRGLCGWI
ncbi:28S ribosomal protein S29, mitochondrial [Galendromus occidentalis]|uniref:Small ribosomal subunit protein mS29 n=1 Tax=Galendromus occidentalis TaxID=34638 RepID=A0AAJ6QUP0_9ACAR|nr:28S ribosomal protein S29, mitochondrial [Galendromus occidentalis]